MRKCFVIMPFGDKLNIDGRLIDAIVTSAADGVALDPALVEPIDFDAIYENIIAKAVATSEFDLEPIRCDEIPGAGSIHADMFRHIYQDDVVVVDISTLNANVFYELGIRHTLKRCVTVLIQRKGTSAPFNIQGFRVITYDEHDAEGAVAEIAEYIDEGLANTAKNHSPVYLHLPELDVRSRIKALKETRRVEYDVAAVPGARIGIITGDIDNIEGIDVWVNSENTNMQMARFHDRGVSAVIRWLGAKKKRNGRVSEDTIAEELRELMDGDSDVSAGTVLPTSSGELMRTHGVKRLFHAAAVDGQLGRGYRPIEDVAACVRGALELMDDPEFEHEGLETILFPLLGAGGAGGSLNDAMSNFVETCLAYLARFPETRIKGIYVIARVQAHLDSGTAVLERTPGIERSH